MKYIGDIDRLARIAEALSAHELDTIAYYRSHLAPRLAGTKNVKDRLTILFAIANSQRQGKGKDNKSLINATARFCQGLEQKIEDCKPLEAPEAHEEFLRWLCDIPGMEQKTANLFLKWVVMFDKDFELNSLDWQSWKSYLHVPFDRWVIKLMGKKYLAFCTETYDKDFVSANGNPKYVSLGFDKEEYNKLQQELRDAMSQQPRIILDTLWFVGSFFCAYYPIICENCWIKVECQNRQPAPDWGSVPTKSKEEVKQERTKKYRELQNQKNRLMNSI